MNSANTVNTDGTAEKKSRNFISFLWEKSVLEHFTLLWLMALKGFNKCTNTCDGLNAHRAKKTLVVGYVCPLDFQL